jgi:amidase
MTSELWRWTAEDIAKGVRTRQISAREALASCLARLEAVNPKVNAVVDLFAEEAFAAADKCDAAVKAHAPLGPLHGVPVTIKINVDYKGRATTNGVVAFKDAIASEDSATVRSLRNAGAVIFGRTNTPCFSTRLFTDNDLHGRTLNPWDAARTPGGSSGGAAAAIALGIGPIAHGNDRAASVRYPAYACGVLGHRPSFGAVVNFNPSSTEERTTMSQFSFAHGVLARSVGDLRLGISAMAAPDARDPWLVPAPQVTPGGLPKRVAVFATLPDTDIDPSVTNAVRQAAKWLEDAGCAVEEAAPPRYAETAKLLWSLAMTEERAASLNETAQSTNAIQKYGDEAVKRTRRGTMTYVKPYDFEGYIRALASRTTIVREWSLFMERYPLLVMPVAWKRPFPIDLDQQGDAAARGTHMALEPSLAVSAIGFPGLAVPTGLDDGGLPTGVQLVAPRFHDETCYLAAEIIMAQCPIALPMEPRL